MATLAIIGAANAQSSVTLFGVVDAAVGHYSVSGGQSVSALVSSGYNSSRLGFRGTEDLGGGMAASFWLEAGINNDNGSFVQTAGNGTAASATGGGGLTFNRRSTVSLSGGFGELRLGRDYTATFWNDTIFDPFGTNGVGTNVISVVSGAALHGGVPFSATQTPTLSTYVRSSNMVAYFLPSNLGGFYGQAQYAFDEQTVGSVGGYKGIRFGYAAGPVNVALAYGKTDGLNTVTTPDVKTINLGASWDFGSAQLIGELSRVTDDTNVGNLDTNGWLLGALVPVGAGQIRVAYSRAKADFVGSSDPTASKLALGYVHNLSKRTALYATYAHVTNKNGASVVAGGSNGYTAPAGVANANSNGYEFGVRHSF